MRRLKKTLRAAAGLAFLGLFSLSSAQGQAPATAAPADKPEKKETPPLCVDCHEDQGKTFPGNPHTRIPGASWKKSVADNKACESCHGPGVKHMDSSGEDKSDIRVFHGRAGADFCVTCHVSNQEHASFKAGIHANTEAVNCLTCHSVHKSEPKTPHLLTKVPSALCETCHPAQVSSFRNKPFAHRIGRGGMECTSCHDPHGRAGQKGLRLTRAGEMPCVTCHAEKRGPFVFEHVNAVVGDCTSCHEAHGSSNPKRLIRARVDRLCLECHSTLTAGLLGSQPPSFHNVSLPRYQNCTTCHTAIHGSNLSPALLK
jgi:DmsE family decaheme c-type cytochrome